MAFSLSSVAGKRLLIIPALTATLMALATTSSFATPVQPNGVVVGTVTCGPSAETAAPQATVAIAGTELVAHTDGTGKFTLPQVPTGEALTIQAMSDPEGSVIASRSVVTLTSGETLDIGNLDLAACPTPASPATTTTDQYQSVQDVLDR
jgi:hypothetical protein